MIICIYLLYKIEKVIEIYQEELKSKNEIQKAISIWISKAEYEERKKSVYTIVDYIFFCHQKGNNFNQTRNRLNKLIDFNYNTESKKITFNSTKINLLIKEMYK